MPRILSNGHLQNRRRRSSIGSISSSSRSSMSMSNSDSGRIQQSALTDWFSVLVGTPPTVSSAVERSTASSKATATSASPLSSLNSSGSNTPPVLASPMPVRNVARRQIIPRRSSTGSAPVTAHTDDSWGQFVDTAEAERELVRHSRVLSKKEMPPRHSICY